MSAADAPTIVELSADDVLRARTEAVAKAGIGRKADHLLEVRGLSTHFFTPDGVVQAVDDVSFDVGYGETLGLVGESGCGKSVTALSIARLVPDPPGKIVAGSILFDGIDVLKLNSEDMRKLRGKEIGFIFQDPLTSLNPTLTIGYQIGEAIREHMGLSEKAAAGTDRRAALEGRDPEGPRTAEGLPVPVLGRDAPARDDRDRAVVRSESSSWPTSRRRRWT